MFTTTWFRYFFKRYLSLFIGCVFFLFFLFVLTDLMSQIKDIFDPKSDKLLWLKYYICMFPRRLEVLIPFSLLISGTILLTSIARKKEMIPLLNAGLSLKHQIKPFFVVALLAMCALWTNAEYMLPWALQTHDEIKEIDFGREQDKATLPQKLGSTDLSDGSKIFFQQANLTQKELYDVYWLPRSENMLGDKIIHIEVVSYQKAPIIEGTAVDVVERDKEGICKKTHTLQRAELSSMKLTDEDIVMATHPAKHFSLYQLLKMSIRMAHSSSEKASDILITLLLKLLSPLTCLLVVIFPIPWCLSFGKARHVVLLLFLFLALLFMFHLCVQTCTTLARIPGSPAFLILILPWTIAGTYGIKRLNRFLSYV